MTYCDVIAGDGPANRLCSGLADETGDPKCNCVHRCYSGYMDTVTGEVSTRELRSQLSDVLGRAMYAGERIGVTRNGKLAAVVISVADLEALEEFEMAQDAATYRAARAADDGTRVTLTDLRAELAP